MLENSQFWTSRRRGLMLRGSLLQITNFHYNECWHVSSTECSSPQQCSSGMSKEGFSSSQQDKEFQSKSHRPADGQQFIHHGIQMSKITTDHMGEASEKVNCCHYNAQDRPSLQGCRHFCHCCLLPPPVLRLFSRKG